MKKSKRKMKKPAVSKPEKASFPPLKISPDETPAPDQERKSGAV